LRTVRLFAVGALPVGTVASLSEPRHGQMASILSVGNMRHQSAVGKPPSSSKNE
jgi:hypothetical protein